MNFCSVEFWIFLIIVFAVYWLLKRARLQNTWLLIVSYYFYALWSPICALLLAFSSSIAYFSGIIIEKSNAPKTRKKICLAGVFVNLAILCYFKYTNFFIDNFNTLMMGMGLHVNSINILLPVGISFYTFSIISYIVDCYRGELKPTKDIIVCFLYASFFPAILSGPIHKGAEQLPQYLKHRKFDRDLAVKGLRLILWGTFMKICIADRLGVYVDEKYDDLYNQSGTTLLLSSIFYTFQIYADFAGYSNIAIGIGYMLCIRLRQNFERPYFSKSITEFWTKWHISLTSWLKSYLYIPLGGNRVSRWHWVTNIMIVFILSGLWHGAASSFILWGAIHGLCQVLEKMAYGKMSPIKANANIPVIQSFFKQFFTLLMVNLAWIFFRLDVNKSFYVVYKIFTDFAPTNLNMTSQSSISFTFLTIILLIILLVKDAVEQFDTKFGKLNRLWSCNRKIRWACYYALCLIIFILGMNSSETFVYYQF